MNVFLKITSLASLLLTTLLQPVHSQKRSAVKKQPMLTLSNPVSKIKLTFHQPAILEDNGEVAAWQKITIKTPDDEFTIVAGSMNGYMVETDPQSERNWSPDGKYIALYRAHGILNKKKFSGYTLTVIELDYGEESSFTSKRGETVNKDNFYGWYKNKPHVVRKGTDRTNVFEEALPADESAKN